MSDSFRRAETQPCQPESQGSFWAAPFCLWSADGQQTVNSRTVSPEQVHISVPKYVAKVILRVVLSENLKMGR